MLAKRLKLSTRYRVQRVFEKGRKLRGSIFTLWYYPNKIGLRIAVITPTKLKVRPVIRNRIRRRLYETIRLAVFNKESYASLRYDIVLVAHTSGIAEMKFSRLAQELIRFMQNLQKI